MLNESDAVNRSTANGVTTVFPYTWKIYDKSEIEVLSNLTVLTVDVDFTVDGIGSDGGGNVTMSSAPSNGTIITRLRKQPTTQASNYQSEAFPPERIEKDFDKLAMRLQQVKEALRRCLSFVKSSSTVDQAIDTPTEGLFARAKVGGGIDWATPAAVNASLPLAVSDGGTGATNAAAARANLLISPLPISEGGTGAVTQLGALASLGASEIEPTDFAWRLRGSNDTSKKFAMEVDGLTPATTRIVTVQDTNGTMALLGNAQPNPIINGNMDIWQRGTTFAVTSSLYTADRWQWFRSTTSAAATISRSTNVPTVAQAGILFNYSLEVDVTTADAVVDAGDSVALRHAIEGYNWRQFAQRQFTVSFWVMSSKAGIHCLAAADEVGSPNYIYVGEYTINSANTWEYKSVTFSASPSAGTWNYTEGAGIALYFGLMAGSNYQQAAGSWIDNAAAFRHATSSQVNVMDSTANFFRITGVKMEHGSVATPIQFVPFEMELMRCQRYYQKSFLYGTAPAQNVGFSTGEEYIIANKAGAVSQSSHRIRFRSPMRSSPTLTAYNPAAANALFRDTVVPADTASSGLNAGSSEGFYPIHGGHASTVVGNLVAFHWTADAEL